MGSVYKQPETGEDNPVTAGGCQVSRRGHKGGAKGSKSKGNCAMYICKCIYVQRNDWKFE
jgi:hypothetical protein